MPDEGLLQKSIVHTKLDIYGFITRKLLTHVLMSYTRTKIKQYVYGELYKAHIPDRKHTK